MTDPAAPPFIPPMKLANDEVWDAVLPRLEEAVKKGQFVLSPAVEEFESAAAEAFEAGWAVGTSSGASALLLALRAAPLEPGSRIALPANTFFADLEAIVQAGHVPVVVDHDEDFVLSPELLEPLDVDAVIPVHLYGLPADMDGILELARSRGWWVLEDACQAHGATVGGRSVGALGHAGAFSSYPTKNLGAWGDAGFVVGSDPELGARIRALRHHGQRRPNVHEDIGSTDRIDSLQAIVLLEKLKRLRQEVEARRRVAEWYRQALDGTDLDLPGDRGNRAHAYHLFVVRVPDRDRVRQRMQESGVGTMVHYPTPIHLQPAARDRCEIPSTPKRAEEWGDQILSLPMYPTLTQDEVGRVADALRVALGR
jgi:dTDP-4-amino-4,6-dideoxygalactose transaminase